MSKLTKAQAKDHQMAQELLTQDALTWSEKLFVIEHWREDAEHLNSAAGAFFTPWGLARDFALHIVGDRILDLCAGIGTLSLAYWQRCELDRREGRSLGLVCVEKNPAYVAVGRKLLPEATWICADVLDPATLAGLGRFDTAAANPPFGRLARAHNGPRYTGAEFEFHVIDAGCAIADHGAFILPQQSAGFRYSGSATGYRRDESAKYARFERETGIVLDAGIGVDTTYPGYGSWHGVAPLVEIATTNDRSEHRCAANSVLAAG